MYDALQPLISQLDEKPTRGQILTQLGTIELALQTEHPTMLYSEILTHAYERLAQNLNGEPRLSSDSRLDPEPHISQSHTRGMRGIRSIHQRLASFPRFQ